MKLRLGTRGSALALAQSRRVAQRLEQLGVNTELIVIKTRGDEVRDREFQELGHHGVFVRELEIALLQEEVDLAVHSYKDLPSTGPHELIVAAVPEREDAADVLLVAAERWHEPGPVLPLAEGAVVGTAAARRRSLLRHHRPDLKLAFLRGNVPTRIEKLRRAEVDAILLAAAGLERLHHGSDVDMDSLLANIVVQRLEPERFVPAPTQGAVACQVRRDDSATVALVARLDDRSVSNAIEAERCLLAHVQGGCEIPFGALCTEAANGELSMVAFLERQDGFRSSRQSGSTPQELARSVFDELTLVEGDRNAVVEG